jgi:sphinganine-1-phosphate aldolase
MSDLFDSYPYAERFGVNRELPDSGRSREEILGELRTIATEEDQAWEDGRCSGTMYCGDRDHYAFLKEAFGLFAHQNALQRDMCPSATRFEGEIIAMALDLMHADAISDGEPAGMVTSGGSASIAQAMLADRQARNRPPRLRQGLPPLRDRASAGASRPRDDPCPPGGRRGGDG